jgi:hypothetical protein
MDQPESAATFHWASPLGVSVICFLVSGVVHLLIGTLTPIFVNSAFGRSAIFISHRTDSRLFGAAPSELLDRNEELATFRTLFLTNAGGALVVIGIFIVSLAWFGLRQHQVWAFVSLVLAGLVVLPYWFLVFKPYVIAGISIRLGDLPPIFWIPTLVLLPGTIFGWLGLRS